MRKFDWHFALFFLLLTVSFFALCIINESFFKWVFERHQNQWSWYIRPLFLLPFCFAAYKKSLSGISLTVFCIFTSMFWFQQPDHVNENVISFLSYEMNWLQSDWTLNKVVLALTVPVSFFCLAIAFWNRNFWFGIATLVLIATGKISWSIYEAGDSGKSIIVPALIGLIICIAVILIGIVKMKKKTGQ